MSFDPIAALLEPEIPALRRYALALVRDNEAADDLVQDCLERALSRWLDRGFGFAVSASTGRERLLAISEAVHHSFNPVPSPPLRGG